MSRAMMAVPFVVLCALSIAVPSVWANWLQDGVAICTMMGDKYDPTITSDGAGGAIVTWRDQRNGNADIYAQRVNASGAILWTTAGIALCAAAGDQSAPMIASDGAGGAIVTWRDLRIMGNADIYAQRVNASGVVQWTADGLALCAALGDQSVPTIASDGTGGAIVTWRDGRSGNADIYAQRVNASGVIQWTVNGLAVCTTAGDQYSPMIVSDGAGGAIVTWQDLRGVNWDVYAQRVNATGATQWTANGLALCEALGDQSVPTIASDGAGGAIVTWRDGRSGNADIYAQRVSASGIVQYTANGVAICTATGDQYYPKISSSGAEGAIITWQDQRSYTPRIYAQRVNASGSVQWTADGVALCRTIMSYQVYPAIVSDSWGGAIITWQDGRSGSNNDIYAQRVSASGTVLWAADGIAVCTALRDQGRPAITSDGAGGAIVAWDDFRNIYFHIYGQRVSANGSGSSDIIVRSPIGEEKWKVGESHAIEWSIELSSLDSIGVLLSIDSGAHFDHAIVSGLPGTTTSYSWTVPNLPVSTARIKVVAYYENAIAGDDMSDADFTIKGAPYRYVSKSGGDVFPYSLPAWASPTIQAAVSAGVAGDTIIVAGDTYNQAITVEAPVYLSGGWSGDFAIRDPETFVTTIRAEGGSLVSFMNVATGSCGIEGFTLKSGYGTSVPMPTSGVYGGAILSCQSSPVIRNNRIESCGVASVLDNSGGGGIACDGGTAVIEGNRIEGCFAQRGGGVYLYETTATIRGNRIAGCRPNLEYNATGHGGGVYALHSTVALEGNTIENNDGYRKGAGIYLYLSPATFSGDTIALNDGIDAGGGIAAERSALTLSRVVVRQNSTSSFGGGVWQRSAKLLMTNCIVAANRSKVIGGGMYADSCWGSVTNNTFDRNRAAYGGGNVFLGSTPSLSIANNIVTHGVMNGFQTSNMTNIAFRFNNCFGNTPLNLAAAGADTTNISRNPYYADTTAFDYHILVHSGGIDTGDPSGSNDPDGSRADQGAFGGSGALMAAPEYVKNLLVSAPNDTTINLAWDELGAGAASYAVYGSPTPGFLPSESVFLGSVPVPGHSFSHLPITGCRYYRVSAVSGAGYGGGYSNQAGACTPGPDVVAPTVAVVYPNGGEIFEIGDTIRVEWTATDNRRVDSISVYYSENAGRSYALLAHGWRADSSYQWIIPPSLSDSCRVRVVAYDPALLVGVDESDLMFVITNVIGVHDDGGDDGTVTPHYATALEQNYPNPFNGTTSIFYSIGERCEVEIKLYDPAGRVVRTLERTQRSPGRYSVLWNGRDGAGRGVASGVYFCRIKAGKYRGTNKIVYLR